MAINYTTVLKLPKPDANTPSWATYMHRLADILDGGVVTVTKTSGATTFADAQGAADNGKKPIIRTSVTITSTVVVGVPAKHRVFLAENFSGGTGRWKIATASNGNGVIVPKNKRMLLRSTTTGVLPASRTDGRSTATEIGLAVITATHIGNAAILNAALATGAVALTKIAGGGSYGRIMYTATSAGFAWTTLARGNANEELAMSTAAVSKPVWRPSSLRKVATSTGMSFSAGDVKTYTHGITGISNKYDYRFIQLMFECLTTDLNYSVGDVVYLDSDVASSNQGVHAIADATTTVKVLISSAGVVFFNKSTQAAAAINTSRWALRVRVGV